MNDVDLVFGQLRHLFLIGGDDIAEFADGAMTDIVEQRNDADAVRQHADEFFQRPRALGRLDSPYHAAPRAVRHPLLLSPIRNLRESRISYRIRQWCKVWANAGERDRC